jgi:hypothetical protein
MIQNKGGMTTRDYVTYAARFAILILLPFMLGAFVFPHTQDMSGQMLRSPSETKSGDEITYSFSHSNNDITVPSRVNAIFPLSDYLSFPPLVSHSAPQLCFQDNDSYLLLSDGTTFDPEFSWVVNFNNQTAVLVVPEGTNCTNTNQNGSNDYRWYVKMALPNNDSRFKGNLTFVPQTLTYPRITMDFGLLQGLIMIPVCYLFVWYPAAGIWKKLHKGIREQ